MRKLVWLLPVIALIIGCGGDEDANDYLPIAVGNSWTYDMVYQTILGDTTEYTGISTTEITRETTLNNNIAVLEQVTTMLWDDTTMANSVDTTYIQTTDDYLLIYDDLADTEPDTSLVLPIEQGNTWTVYADTADTMTAEVIEQVNITVPAGAYTNCWNIQYTSLGQIQDNWLALDVGIVKHHMQMLQQTMLIDFTKELTSYTVQ